MSMVSIANPAYGKIDISSAPEGSNPPSGVTNAGGESIKDHRLHKPGVTGSSPVAANVSVLFDESIEAYHGDTSHYGSTQIGWADRSLALFFARAVLRTSSGPSSDALTLGKHWHTLRELGPDQFGELAVVVPPDFTTAGGALSTSKGAKEWIASLKPGQIPLTQDLADTLGRMQDGFDRNAAAVELEATALHREASIRWESTAGMRVRCRPDLICEGGRLADFKSSRVEDIRRDFKWSVKDYRYGLSAALYEQGCLIAGLADPPMHFIVTQTVEPWETEVLTLPPAYMDWARSRLEQLLTDIAARLKSGDWTREGYGEVHEIAMPGFGDRGMGSGYVE